MTIDLNDERTEPGYEGWYDGGDQALVEWDNTHVAALFSDYSSGTDTYGGGVARMLTVGSSGLVAGPKTRYYDEAVDPESNYGRTHSQIRVGDLLVQYHNDTGRMFTFTFNGSAFVLVDVMDPVPFGSEDTYPAGVRLFPWTDATMLMVKASISSAGTGAVRFAHWTGTTWEVGSATVGTVSFGSTDYLVAARLNDQTDGSRAVVFVDQWYAPNYLVVKGDYPAAPTLTTATTIPSGVTGYFNYEAWSIPDLSNAIRVLPVERGTLTKITGGSEDFDWAYMRLTLNGGQVTEGGMVSMGARQNGYYDIAMTQTTTGEVWAAYATYTAANHGSSIQVKNISTGVDTQVIDLDDGIIANDYSVRSIARAGSGVVVAWKTRGKRIVRAELYPPPPVMVGAKLKDGQTFWG